MSHKQSYLISRFVILFSLLVAVCLGIALWDINPWPTDAEAYYMPAALRIPHLHSLSEIHSGFDMENVRWLHGKEFFIAAISFFQFLLNDFETLRPLMMLGLVAVAVSAILIFYIARRFWGEWIALFCYLAFSLCLWPYLYILFAKHQTLGLMFFLISVALLLNLIPPTPTKRNRRSLKPLLFFWPILSGVSLGLAFFSSTVTSLYLPYYAAAFLVILFKGNNENSSKEKLKMSLGSGFLVITGFLLIFFYVNLPDLAYNIKSFAKYIVISGSHNHFYYNQTHLQQWFPHLNVGEVRGGWEWIFKYFFVIMPVLFPLYLTAVGYLGWRFFQEKKRNFRLEILGLILLSFASPVMAEIAKVAQYGANYFPTLLGIVMLLGYAVYDLRKYLHSLPAKRFKKVRMQIQRLLIGMLAVHGSINLYLFVSDVYPCRMATTFLCKKIKELHIDRLWTYPAHFHRNNFVYSLNMKMRDELGWLPMKYLAQAEQGYILVPPPTGDSLYVASKSAYNNFDKDIFLIQLIRSKMLKDCSVASFKTLANSWIWRQEEEILSYRHLILGHPLPDEDLGRVWLLDSQKVKAQLTRLFPRPEDLPLLKGNTNNIGTLEKFFIFDGQRIGIPEMKEVSHIVAKLWKVGNPSDGLTGSLYRLDSDQPIWLPAGKNFTTQPLLSSQVSKQISGISAFTFDPPLKLEQGVYYFMVNRTGKPDNENYYQIDNKHFAVQ